LCNKITYPVLPAVQDKDTWSFQKEIYFTQKLETLGI